MTTIPVNDNLKIKHPIDLASRNFVDNKWAHYKWLREEEPVYKGKVSVLPVYMVSRYVDCVELLKSDKLVRQRKTATGGSKLNALIPKSFRLMTSTLIQQDDPEHKRLRNLVHKAFTPRAIGKLQQRLEGLTHNLLDQAEAKSNRGKEPFDLIESYAHPIPVTMIGEMVGIDQADMPKFSKSIGALTKGLTGTRVIRTLAWDLPMAVNFARELIRRKHRHPGDDILTGLIQAEDEGSQLSEDELVSMVLLLILAGFETTVHLISCATVALLEHSESLLRIRNDNHLLDSAIEEVLRFVGPVHTTETNFARDDIALHGVTIPKGSTVFPLLGAANRDPDMFADPDLFDIERNPNRHLGFSQGIHYCLGAPLARLETKIALANLLERAPNLRLAVPGSALLVEKMPLMHRYERVPVSLK